MSESGLPVSFHATLKAMSDWLEADHVPYTLIGGIATSLLAYPRTTQDIDAVIWLEESHWETFLQSGAQRGFVSRISDPLNFAARARMFLLRFQASGISM